MNMPRATHAGNLKIGSAELPCAVLEDGTRVLTQEGFLEAIGRARKAKGGQGASSASRLPAFLSAKNLTQFIPDDLMTASSPVIFKTVTGGRAFGYKAELLPLVCQVYLNARDNKALSPTQEPIAAKCDILIRGLAAVGIVALVDEATGYQNVRAREALERILEAFISDELLKWAKTFPDEFYRQLFRLRGWHMTPLSVKRPILVGKLTNGIVYERLAPGVLDELKKKTPKDDKGRRVHKYHQWLTEDVGNPRLREHLAAVIALMRASATWDGFSRALERAFPKLGTTPPFQFDDLED
jgi:hypothetical protein